MNNEQAPQVRDRTKKGPTRRRPRFHTPGHKYAHEMKQRGMTYRLINRLARQKPRIAMQKASRRRNR